MKKEQLVEDLFNKYIRNECSLKEVRRLMVEAGVEDQESLLLRLMKNMEDKDIKLKPREKERLEDVYQRIIGEISTENPVIDIRSSVVLFRQRVIRWIAAAIILAMIGGGTYVYLLNDSVKEAPGISYQAEPEKDVAPPSGDKAVLTLADGTVLELDNSNEGTLASQGEVNIVKLGNGQIVYKGSAGGNIRYNTLTVPRGSKPLKLMLADGTLVWLNVASSITYPTAFSGKERMVEVSGEVYFEVAPLALKRTPLTSEGGYNKVSFIVEINSSKGEKSRVEVLGTHFCINAYDDEKDIRVSLLEGSVKVSKGGLAQNIRPGQQARISRDLKVVDNVDMESVMAWKNGYFSFQHTDLPSLMRQLARWYNVDVQFEGKVTDMKFGGGISRNTNLSQVLKILEENDIRCRIDKDPASDRPGKIIVSP